MKLITDCIERQRHWQEVKMDCQSKDGLIIFLLILSGELVVESKRGLIIVNSFQESLQPLSPGALCYFAGRGYTLNQSFTGTETSNLSFTFLLQMESSLLSPWGAPQLCCTESCHCEIKATEILKVLWKLVRSKMREDYTACGVGVALRECNKCENERPWRYSVIWSPLFTLLSSCHRLHHRFQCNFCFGHSMPKTTPHIVIFRSLSAWL